MEVKLINCEKALTDLFQACSDLPLEEMDRMEAEINAASEALAPKDNAPVFVKQDSGTCYHCTGIRIFHIWRLEIWKCEWGCNRLTIEWRRK